MNKKIGKIILSLSTILLMGGALYVGTLLIQPPGNSVTTVKKTKAASFTYTRYLAYNAAVPTGIETPTPLILPTEEPTEIPTTVSPTVSQVGVTVTGTENQEETITPTEIILAKNYTTPSTNPSIKPSAVPKVPESGWTQYSLVIFAGASLLVFFAFLF